MNEAFQGEERVAGARMRGKTKNTNLRIRCETDADTAD
eukprot:CAMPEP_0174888596 /NCGR_PEP_ID=MMETSP0167-20121228/3876_1 /TAXON_ID=38298 /ORGANISM="Rhodella maculata, Strain CCMP736" /LENGTH=37 /DNA_ID= /DNA_START= /DNA_END= /DNA_ORIENTATION=